jgi:hypothetical protein
MKSLVILALSLAALGAQAQPYIPQSFPILQALEASGVTLSDEAKEWNKKWKGMDLEDEAVYQFKELSGSTSINLKIRKLDASDPDGYKSRGSFVPRNGAANPDTEIAYYNLASLLGWGRIIRPAARYELGRKASAVFKELIERGNIRGSLRLENKQRILNAIQTGRPLKGCVKAKKPDSEVALNSIANPRAGRNGEPVTSHPIIRSLQARNPLPAHGADLELKTGYVGDAYELAREYSVLMTLDAVFQQWDRYSGGNVIIIKDEATGRAHFYSTDNGGADVSRTTGWVETNLGYFSRYDRDVVDGLAKVLAFLENPASGYLGYTSAETFVVDLGLYSQLKPADYVERLKRNLKLVLKKVRDTEARYGAATYL